MVAVLPLHDMSLSAGTGCYVKAVAYGSEREPVVIGKPHTPMLKVIQERYIGNCCCLIVCLSLYLIYSTHLEPTRSLMIGDR